VVANDRSEAVFALALLAQPEHSLTSRWVLADLDPDRTYTVARLEGPGEVLGLSAEQPGWIDRPVRLTGRTLMTLGLQPPLLHPESVLLIHLT
jgi:alpha-galactosidase